MGKERLIGMALHCSEMIRLHGVTLGSSTLLKQCCVHEGFEKYAIKVQRLRTIVVEICSLPRLGITLIYLKYLPTLLSPHHTQLLKPAECPRSC
jgi:hypothetical protein